MFEGIGIIKTQAKNICIQSRWENSLYALHANDQEEEKETTFIPYFAWANRSRGEMLVCIRKES